MLLDVGNPLLARLVLVMHQLRGPGPLDEIFGPLALHDDLVSKPARLGQDLEVQRVRQVSAVDDGDGRCVCAAEGDGAAGLWRKELRNHAKGVLAVDGELVVLLRPAVALRREELDVGLRGGQPHWVTAG